MIHWIFAAARLFPYWALPLALVMAELGIHFRRTGRNLQWGFFSGVGILLLGTVSWFYFRGDLHSDRWVKTVLIR